MNANLKILIEPQIGCKFLVNDKERDDFLEFRFATTIQTGSMTLEVSLKNPIGTNAQTFAVLLPHMDTPIRVKDVGCGGRHDPKLTHLHLELTDPSQTGILIGLVQSFVNHLRKLPQKK